jgi:hypothetical protein
MIHGMILGGDGGASFTNPLLVTLTITPATPGTALTLNGGTLTGASAPALIVNQTWNNVATNFTGVLLNVTSTLSATASKLLDLQVGGASQFFVNKSGVCVAVAVTGQFGVLSDNSNGSGICSQGILVGTNSFIYFYTASGYSAAAAIPSSDVSLKRDGVGILSQRSGTTAQTFRVYGTWTDASNGDWLNITKAAGGASTLSTIKNGTGIEGDLALRGGASGASLTLDDATTLATFNGVVNVANATATPAAGSVAARLLFGTTAGFGIYYGSGAPTVSAAQGSLYLRSDGSGIADRFYVNTTGSTTWTNFVTAA